MATYPVFAVADVAEFSGRPVESYSSYVNEALKQAKLLFKFATGLSEWPDDEDDAELASYAILSLADAIVLSQPHTETLYSPFQSETIGSYSYSKAVKAIRDGTPLGISWFDLAVQRLSILDLNSVQYGDQGAFYPEVDFIIIDDKKYIIGPDDIGRWEVSGGSF